MPGKIVAAVKSVVVGWARQAAGPMRLGRVGGVMFMKQVAAQKCYPPHRPK